MIRENLMFLLLSISLSAGRNITTKKTAVDAKERSGFFASQTILFGSAALLLFSVALTRTIHISTITFVYGIVYGCLLILSQWMFTLALKSGRTSICSVVYSLGFILPTVAGTFFWQENFTLQNGIGVVLAIVVILLTAKKSDADRQSKQIFVPFIMIAMVSSGGLGILQKMQGASHAVEEKTEFLLIAFALAFLASFVAFLWGDGRKMLPVKKAIYPCVTGICFGGANICNTILAGRMKSAVFFPLQNIATILATTLLGVLLFKEKITYKTASILLLGILIVILFSIS